MVRGNIWKMAFKAPRGAISRDLIENSVSLSQRSGDMSTRRGDEVVVALGHDDSGFFYFGILYYSGFLISGFCTIQDFVIWDCDMSGFLISGFHTRPSELYDIIVKSNKPYLFLYIDGGQDHQVKYIKTQIVLISLFLALDLDYLVAVRTPPGHSWKSL